MHGRAHSCETDRVDPKMETEKPIVRTAHKRPFDILIGKLLFESNIRHLMNYENNRKNTVKRRRRCADCRVCWTWWIEIQANVYDAMLTRAIEPKFNFGNQQKCSYFGMANRGEKKMSSSISNTFAGSRCKYLLQTDQWISTFPLFKVKK